MRVPNASSYSFRPSAVEVVKGQRFRIGTVGFTPSGEYVSWTSVETHEDTVFSAVAHPHSDRGEALLDIAPDELRCWVVEITQGGTATYFPGPNVLTLGRPIRWKVVALNAVPAPMPAPAGISKTDTLLGVAGDLGMEVVELVVPMPAPEPTPAPTLVGMEEDVPAILRLTMKDRMGLFVRDVVKDHGGNIQKAAASLGVQRSTVYRHLDREPTQAPPRIWTTLSVKVTPLAVLEVFRWLILEESSEKDFAHCGLPLVGIINEAGQYRFGKTREIALERFGARGRPPSRKNASIGQVEKMLRDALDR